MTRSHRPVPLQFHRAAPSALLIAIMVVMDVWRAPQAPPAFAATPLRTLTGESTTLATLSE
ncbi:hypothetical protein MJI37_34480, partial [Salmonella enterica subsp. enterica serovar Cerro]|nr:hypothetical protein [Salmonella enterica subsp. enterica serovar Cerro]